MLFQYATMTHSFQAARIAADLPLVEPAYCIDPTEPNERLQVQKEFDVGRAVKHLIVSGDDYAENLRPQLSPVAELQAIKRLGVKAIEEKPWIPQWNLADSEVYKEFGRRKERSIAARKNGRTRDRALMRLVEEGLIEADFVDSDP